MKLHMQNWDVAFGIGMAGVTITLSQFNLVIAALVGVFSLGVMVSRFGSSVIQFRKDWRNRNKQGDKDETKVG